MAAGAAVEAEGDLADLGAAGLAEAVALAVAARAADGDVK